MPNDVSACRLAPHHHREVTFIQSITGAYHAASRPAGQAGRGSPYTTLMATEIIISWGVDRNRERGRSEVRGEGREETEGDGEEEGC